MDVEPATRFRWVNSQGGILRCAQNLRQRIRPDGWLSVC
jgi:hypothetical protein